MKQLVRVLKNLVREEMPGTLHTQWGNGGWRRRPNSTGGCTRYFRERVQHKSSCCTKNNPHSHFSKLRSHHRSQDRRSGRYPCYSVTRCVVLHRTNSRARAAKLSCWYNPLSPCKRAQSRWPLVAPWVGGGWKGNSSQRKLSRNRCSNRDDARSTRRSSSLHEAPAGFCHTWYSRHLGMSLSVQERPRCKPPQNPSNNLHSMCSPYHSSN